LSGPAGGLKGARFVAALGGDRQLLSFDMGGTSTDVALINGDIALTSEGHIGDYPVAVPMVDMHTIGAGGGSIARVDAGGLLLVGPESAGADPGPACYGRGGTAATVTDANLVLGRLQVDGFLGGRMQLDLAAAQRALDGIGDALGLSREQAAEGVIRVANEHMARALRVMSVQRGIDPAVFTLVSFGGAGGLHVCALAESLGMDQALVPVQAGVLSALGMLVAAPSRDMSRTLTRLLADCDQLSLEQAFQALRDEALADMANELQDQAAHSHYSVDCRYQGQSFTLNLPWSDLDRLAEAFHQLHKQRYGHDLDIPVELVNIRVSVQGPERPPQLQRLPGLAAVAGDAEPGRAGDAGLYGLAQSVPVYQRGLLAQGQCISGPALILEQVSTTYVQPGWGCRVDAWGNLRLHRQH